MDIEALRTFIIVAETESFTRASEQQYCTQAAVSMRIKRLETELECTLFKRTAKKAALTHEGEILLPLARQIVNISENAKEVLYQRRLMEHSEICLACSSTPGTYIIPGKIYLFRRKHPYITIQSQVQYTKNVIENVLNKSVPLGIVSQPLFDSTDVLASEPIMDDPLVLVVSPKHPWAALHGIYLRELRNETLLISNAHTSMVGYLEKCGGFTLDLKQLHVAGNLEAIKLSVASNQGVSVISRYAAQQELELGLLHEVATLDSCNLARTIYCIHRKDTPLALSVKLFLDFLRGSENP